MKWFINNDRGLIRKGGRYTIPFSEDELRNKILELTEGNLMEEGDLREAAECLCSDFYNEIKHSKVYKDLAKVKFEPMNLEVDPCCWQDHEWLGFHTSASGFAYLGCVAGGDCEFPIYFAIYFDGTNLRGYIPKYHNTYNLKTRMAFGINDEWQTEIFDYLEFDSPEDKEKLWNEAFEDYEDALFTMFEASGLFEDIESRVEIRS